jgi:hypothetical protein
MDRKPGWGLDASKAAPTVTFPCGAAMTNTGAVDYCTSSVDVRSMGTAAPASGNELLYRKIVYLGPTKWRQPYFDKYSCPSSNLFR